jgi:hypothetical protein
MYNLIYILKINYSIMKGEKIKNVLLKAKTPFISIIKYTIITAAIISAFYLGRFIENQEMKSVIIYDNVNVIKKSDINIAIDEGNNLLLVDNETGNYTILQDSIGQSIYKLYSSNIWNKNAVNTKNAEE